MRDISIENEPLVKEGFAVIFPQKSGEALKHMKSTAMVVIDNLIGEGHWNLNDVLIALAKISFKNVSTRSFQPQSYRNPDFPLFSILNALPPRSCRPARPLRPGIAL